MVSSVDGNLDRYAHESLQTLARQILFGDDASELDVQRSLNLAQSSLDYAPTALRSLTTLTYARIRNNQNELAMANNNLALMTDPNDGESNLLQVILLAGAGELDSAKKRFGKLLEDRGPISDYPDRLFLHASIELFPERRNTKTRSSIKVTTLEDELDGPDTNGLSLREALLLAQPNDSIEFDVSGALQLKLGALMINKSVDLIGPGIEKLTVDANGQSRIFYVNDGNVGPDAKVEISGMKLVGGRAHRNSADDPVNRGGGIYSRENLTIEDCALEDHFALQGGAIWVDHGSTMTIDRCAFTKNKCTDAGGAIASCGNKYGDRTFLNIANSTFTKNEAELVGGAIGTFGHLSVVNSTIHANIARSASEGGKWNGGGIACIDAYSRIRLNHCTITDNSGGGASFNRYDPNVFVGRSFTSPIRNEIRNCIISGNTKLDSDWDVGHCRTSKHDVVNVRHSLIGVGQGMVNKGDNLLGEDPKLGPLSDNGGTTRTRKLLPASPCVEAGIESSIEKDQTGKKRVGAPDMGAFELVK
jgi:predicted outer membrane repeat protein